MSEDTAILARFASARVALADDDSASVDLVVTNDADTTQIVALEVTGVPSAWASLRPATIAIDAKASVVATLTIDLPTPRPEPGRYVVAVRADTERHSGAAHAETTVDLAPPRRWPLRRVLPLLALLVAVAAALVVVAANRSTNAPNDLTAATGPIPTGRGGVGRSIAPHATTPTGAPLTATTTTTARASAAVTPTPAAAIGRFLQTSPGGALEVRSAFADGRTVVQRAAAAPRYGPYVLLTRLDRSDLLLLRNEPTDNPVTAQLLRVGDDGAPRIVREVSGDIGTYGYTNMVGIGNRWVYFYKEPEGFAAAQRWDESGHLTGRLQYPAPGRGWTDTVTLGDGHALLYNRTTGAGLVLTIPYTATSYSGTAGYQAVATRNLGTGWSTVVGLGDGRVLFAARDGGAGPAEVRLFRADGTDDLGAGGTLNGPVVSGVALPGSRVLLVSGDGAGFLVTVEGQRLAAVLPATAGTGRMLAAVA
jgi:hypothetical protein